MKKKAVWFSFNKYWIFSDSKTQQKKDGNKEWSCNKRTECIGDTHLKPPGEFSGGLVFKISAFITRGAVSLPGEGIKIPPAIQWDKKKKKKKMECHLTNYN